MVTSFVDKTVLHCACHTLICRHSVGATSYSSIYGTHVCHDVGREFIATSVPAWCLPYSACAFGRLFCAFFRFLHKSWRFVVALPACLPALLPVCARVRVLFYFCCYYNCCCLFSWRTRQVTSEKLPFVVRLQYFYSKYVSFLFLNMYST